MALIVVRTLNGDSEFSSEIRFESGSMPCPLLFIIIGGVLKRNKSRRFGHVERKVNEDRARKCMCMEGARPRKVRLEVVRSTL
jgi:hypothetical protein